MLFKRLTAASDIPPHQKKISLISPLSGKAKTLDDVPNAIFSQRLFGEGVAIEPSGYQLLAPFDGTVYGLPATAHQIRLRAKNGLKVFIQLGIGSECMLGEGFKAKVKNGDKVLQGQVMLEFDLRIMKQKLTSILCPVTVLNSDKTKAIQPLCHPVRAAEDHIMHIFI